MTYLKTSWFSFGNFLSTSLRACNFCSRSLISEERENQDFRGHGWWVLRAQDRYWSWAGGETSGMRATSGHSPGLSDKVNPSLSPKSFCPRQAHLAVAPTQQPGPPLGPRPLLKGSTVCLGLPGPHYPRLKDPQRHRHKEHHSLLIRLPLETGIPMQKACVLPDQTGERCHPPTPTDCLGREFVIRPGLCPFPRDTRTLYRSPYWRS